MTDAFLQVRDDGNTTKRDLAHGELECTPSDRHLDGAECNEAYNKIFDGIMWLDHIYIDKRACRAANSTGNTCTASICNLSEEGATYHVPQLLDRLTMNVSWSCVIQQDMSGTWKDNQTSIFLYVKDDGWDLAGRLTVCRG